MGENAGDGGGVRVDGDVTRSESDMAICRRMRTATSRRCSANDGAAVFRKAGIACQRARLPGLGCVADRVTFGGRFRKTPPGRRRCVTAAAQLASLASIAEPLALARRGAG